MNSSLPGELQLLARIAVGDERAFRTVFDFYRDRLYALGLHITRSPLLAEDIVQDVFLKVWKYRERLPLIHSFNAYLITIAKNTCTDYLRDIAYERLSLDNYRILQLRYEQPDESGSLQYDKIIQAAIQQLPPQQKTAYLLSWDKKKKQSDIAREMNLSIYTVKEYIKLARKAIRKQLEIHIGTALSVIVAVYFC